MGTNRIKVFDLALIAIFTAILFAQEQILTSHEDALKLEEYIYSQLKEQLIVNAQAMQQVAFNISLI